MNKIGSCGQLICLQRRQCQQSAVIAIHEHQVVPAGEILPVFFCCNTGGVRQKRNRRAEARRFLACTFLTTITSLANKTRPGFCSDYWMKPAGRRPPDFLEYDCMLKGCSKRPFPPAVGCPFRGAPATALRRSGAGRAPLSGRWWSSACRWVCSRRGLAG